MGLWTLLGGIALGFAICLGMIGETNNWSLQHLVFKIATKLVTLIFRKTDSNMCESYSGNLISCELFLFEFNNNYYYKPKVDSAIENPNEIVDLIRNGYQTFTGFQI